MKRNLVLSASVLTIACAVFFFYLIRRDGRTMPERSRNADAPEVGAAAARSKPEAVAPAAHPKAESPRTISSSKGQRPLLPAPTLEETEEFSTRPWRAIEWLEAPPANRDVIKRAVHEVWSIIPVSKKSAPMRTREEATERISHVAICAPLTYAFEDEEGFYFSGGAIPDRVTKDFSHGISVRKADGRPLSWEVRKEHE